MLEYAQAEYWLSAAILATAMCGLGCALTARSLLDVVRSPRPIGLIIVLQSLIAPLLAWALAFLIDAPPGIRLGMILIAALPGGLFSNIFAFIGRGNLALSIAATMASSLGCLVTTVMVVRVLGQGVAPDEFSMPTMRILGELLYCMFLPLACGIWIRRNFARRCALIARLLIAVSGALLLWLAAMALGSGRIAIFAFGWKPIAALVFHAIALIWITYFVGWRLGLSIKDSYTAGVEVVVRNAHLGLLLKATLFPAATKPQRLDAWASVSAADASIGDQMLYVLLVYGVISLGVAACETLTRRIGVGFIYGPNAFLGRLYSRPPGVRRKDPA